MVGGDSPIRYCVQPTATLGVSPCSQMTLRMEIVENVHRRASCLNPTCEARNTASE